ncbi:helix-turn-helix domain-containing protein [Chloroflexota bacterium]
MKQAEIAKELGISNSYLSMILNGKRQINPELEAKLQSIPGVHKLVNNQLQIIPCTEEARGSNPLSSTIRSTTTVLTPSLGKIIKAIQIQLLALSLTTRPAVV